MNDAATNAAFLPNAQENPFVMKLSHVSFILAAAASSSGLIGCTADPSPGIPSSQTAGAISYASTSALPSCDASAGLNVAYVVESDSFVVCFEGEWRELSQGAPGKDGKDGRNGAAGRPGPRGFRGFDGAKGEQGPQGIPGAAGADGKDGKDGQTGTPGTNGHSALVEMHDEPAGTNCKAGGVAITVGIDLNDNGELDEGEGKTSYVCHGVSAEPPPPPPVCSPIGLMCISSSECCTGNCVFPSSSYPTTTFPSITPTTTLPTFGTCQDIQQPSCGNAGETCCAGECMSGLTCDSSTYTCTAAVCLELSAQCERDTECCSGSCYWSPYNTMHGNCVSPH